MKLQGRKLNERICTHVVMIVALGLSLAACGGGGDSVAVPAPPTTVSPPPPPPPPAEQVTGKVDLTGLDHSEIYVELASRFVDVNEDGSFYFSDYESADEGIFSLKTSSNRDLIYSSYPAPEGTDLFLDEGTTAVQLLFSVSPIYARMKSSDGGKLTYAAFKDDAELADLRVAIKNSVQSNGYLDVIDIQDEFAAVISRITEKDK